MPIARMIVESTHEDHLKIAKRDVEHALRDNPQPVSIYRLNFSDNIVADALLVEVDTLDNSRDPSDYLTKKLNDAGFLGIVWTEAEWLDMVKE